MRLSLNPGSRPVIGTNLTLVTSNLPSTFAALMSAGVSKVAPISLNALGMKGCFLYHSFDAVWYFGVRNGVGRFSVPVPNDARLVGARVYFQSAAPSVASNGGEVLIGNR